VYWYVLPAPLELVKALRLGGQRSLRIVRITMREAETLQALMVQRSAYFGQKALLSEAYIQPMRRSVLPCPRVAHSVSHN
jgi:acetyl/propionyl-CoA carboxylase alpha subunit